MAQFTNITNKVFGRLTAIEFIGRDKFKIALWRCLCECGNESVVRLCSLTSGATKSCGCYNNEARALRMKNNTYKVTHGLTGHELYDTWATMWQRCTNPKNSKYYLYGGRGISIDPAWKDFETFLRDMGDRPEGCTLDRKDCNGDYSKENCRWANYSEQNKNRRKYTRKNQATGLFNEIG